MAMTLDGYRYVLTQHGKQFVNEGLNMGAPLFSNPSAFPQKPAKGVMQINFTGGALHGGAQADGGAYKVNKKLPIDPMFGHRKIFTSQVEIPKGVANGANGADQAVNIVKTATVQSMQTLGLQIEQNMFDRQLAVVTTGATIADSAVTVTVDDATRFREGVNYLWDDNGTINANDFLCTEVVLNAVNGLTGTVKFETAATGTVTATQDKFLLSDTRGALGLTTLKTLAGSGYVYSQAAAIAGWNGTILAHDAVYSTKVVLRAITAMRQRGGNPTCIYFPHVIAEDHRVLIGGTGYRRFNEPGKMDPFGGGSFEIGGVKCLESPNVPGKEIYLIDESKVHLAKFTALEKVEAPRMAEDRYALLATWAGEYEMRCDNRRGVAVITGVARP